MINGEGIQENFSDPASPDPYDELPPWIGKMDADDASPHPSEYSSCGEPESERYCSANSMMGTASFTSSLGTCNEFLDSDLGYIRNMGFGEDRVLENLGSQGRLQRNPRNQGFASLNHFDCLSDGIIEFNNAKGDEETGVHVEESQGLLMLDSSSNSLLNNNKDASTYGVNCAERNDVITVLKAGNELNSLMNLDFDNSSYRLNGNGRQGSTSFRDTSKSRPDLYTPSYRFNGQSESGLLLSFDENISTQQTTNAGHNENLLVSMSQDGSHLGLGSKEESPYSAAVHEEGSTEQVCSDLGLIHGLASDSGFPIDDEMRSGGLSDAEEQSSYRYKQSDDEGSIFGDDTDDEVKVDMYHRRHLKYNQETKIKITNPLLINSSVAFGSDDWDGFMQETEESISAPVLLDKPQELQLQHFSNEINSQNSISLCPSDCLIVAASEQEENSIGIPLASIQNQCTKGNNKNSASAPSFVSPIVSGSEEEENGIDMPLTSLQTQATRGSNEYLNSCSIIAARKDTLTQKASADRGLNIMDDASAAEMDLLCSEGFIGPDECEALESDVLRKSGLHLDPLSNISGVKHCSGTTEKSQDKDEACFEGKKQTVVPLNFKDSPFPINTFKNQFAPIKTQGPGLNESYDEVVHEMEEILLDSGESPGIRFTKGNELSPFQLPLPFRDGSSTASTSGSDDLYPLKIDGVEVVGAKQKKGDVSLGERLVGVKEYSVYKLRVWSGKNQWEVEHRYRDFVSLYRHLKMLFADQGWSLPPPWSGVERESRKIFGNASPDVIAERSVLIQECLQSILHFEFPSSNPSPLNRFLSPQKSHSSSSSLNTGVHDSTSLLSKKTCVEDGSALGKTISLVVEIRPRKSMKELLEAQHYTCAGCHRHFDGQKTLMQEFVRTIGWGKPRLCEYTGQLFCTSCHTNETAVLPARVLNLWDFTYYPVSQLAKSYLESIHDQPMLCVSAVNPFLFSKIPALHNVMAVRKKIGAMLPHVRCPFRSSIHKGLGSRRYLLESNDFFALRDLIDLSKGAFSALPVMVETVSKKIFEHITEQCLVCCDTGVPCGARQACEDPSSLIFPFQESEVERCNSCESVLHKDCFRKLTSCPCGAHFMADEEAGTTDGDLGLVRRMNSKLPSRFLASLFSKPKQEKTRSPRNSSPVILMGSLPSTSF